MVAGACWGLLWYPLVEFEKLGLGVGLTSAIFYVVTAFCALPGLIVTGVWRQIAKPSLPLITMGLAFTLYTFALLLTHPFNAILLFYLTPVWSILFGKLFYGEPISLVRTLVVIMGCVGVGLVLGATSLPVPKNLGDWIALMSGALWALGTSLASREVAYKFAIYYKNDQLCVAHAVPAVTYCCPDHLALPASRPKGRKKYPRELRRLFNIQMFCVSWILFLPAHETI